MEYDFANDPSLYIACALLLPYEKVIIFLLKTNYIELSKKKKTKQILKFAKQNTVEKEIVIRRIRQVKCLLKHGYAPNYNYLLKEFDDANHLFRYLERLKAHL